MVSYEEINHKEVFDNQPSEHRFKSSSTETSYSVPNFKLGVSLKYKLASKKLEKNDLSLCGYQL